MTFLEQLADAIDPPPHPYATAPAKWVRRRSRDFLWSAQKNILASVVEHRRTAVKACHGPGKSFTVARLAAWWVDTHPVGSALVVTSAPTWDQVHDVLWAELRNSHESAGLPGRVNQRCQWYINDKLVAVGRKPANHNEAGFSGYHRRYVLVILDEACGIPKQLWDAVSTFMTNEDARMVAIGNPDNPASEFFEVCRGARSTIDGDLSQRGWNVITIPIFETPNFTGEKVPRDVAEQLPSKLWLSEKAVEWGEDSPLWSAKVLGEFPADASDGVVPWSWIKQCMGDESIDRVGPLRVPVELGVDVGGGGQDETVIAARQGPVAMPQRWRMSGLKAEDSEVIIDKITEVVKELNVTAVKLDEIGVGYGIVGSLKRRLEREVPWEVAVHGVKVSEAAPGADATKFVNLRAWLWWTVGRELSRTHGWDLTAFDNDEGEQVLAQLAAPRYFEKNGRVQIESKDDVRKRLKRSTDDADALLLAFYVAPPDTPPVQSGPYENRGRRAAR